MLSVRTLGSGEESVTFGLVLTAYEAGLPG
jgi:hypothetical protein